MIDRPFIFNQPRISSYAAFKAELKEFLEKNKQYPKNFKFMEMITDPIELERKNIKARGKISQNTIKFDTSEIIQNYEQAKIKEIYQTKEKMILDRVDDQIKSMLLDLCSKVDITALDVEDIKVRNQILFNPKDSESHVFENELLSDVYSFLKDKQSPKIFLEQQFLKILRCKLAEQQSKHDDEVETIFSSFEQNNLNNSVSLNTKKNDKNLRIIDSNMINSLDIVNGLTTDDINIWRGIRILSKKKFSNFSYIDTYEGNLLYAELFFSLRAGLTSLAKMIVNLHTEFFERTCPNFASVFQEFMIHQESRHAQTILMKDTPTDEFRNLLLKIFSRVDYLIEGSMLVTTEDFLWVNIQTSFSPESLSDMICKEADIPIYNKIFALILTANYSLSSKTILTSNLWLNDVFHILKAICIKTYCRESQRNFCLCIIYIIKNVYIKVEDQVQFFEDVSPIIDTSILLDTVPDLLLKSKLYDLLLHEKFPKDVLQVTIDLMKKSGDYKGLIRVNRFIEKELLEQALISEMMSLVDNGNIEDFLIKNETILLNSADCFPVKELLNLLAFKHEPSMKNLKKTVFLRNDVSLDNCLLIRPAIESISQKAANIAMQKSDLLSAAKVLRLVENLKNFENQKG